MNGQRRCPLPLCGSCRTRALTTIDAGPIPPMRPGSNGEPNPPPAVNVVVAVVDLLRPFADDERSSL